jgi:hypothetical protein
MAVNSAGGGCQMKRIFLASVALLFPAIAFALDIDVETKIGASTETPKPTWANFYGGFDTKAGNIEFLGHMAALTDGYYGGFMGGSYGYGGVAFEVVDGGLTYTGDTISASLGKLELDDLVDSPYSLFLSSRHNKALEASVALHDGTFFYNDQWIALNYNSGSTFTTTQNGSPIYWPDRSAVLKSWGIKHGSFRVALQDVIIYADDADGSPHSGGPFFNPDYFLFPVPSFFIHYIDSSENSPWQQQAQNAKSTMGVMVDWDDDDWYFVSQILVSDFNMNRFINPSGSQNPDKLAWELGGRKKTDLGTFGFYHAGATKYVFEPYGNSSKNDTCAYVFYPDTQYDIKGTPLAFEPEDNYVGYLHGENNIAFMGTWRKNFDRLTAASSLEFTLSGSKSPVNPWGDLLTWSDGGSGTKMFNDSELEKKLVLCASVSMPFGDFDLGVDVRLGYVWNKLKLAGATGDQTDSYVNGLYLYNPSSTCEPIAEIILGAKYHFSL